MYNLYRGPISIYNIFLIKRNTPSGVTLHSSSSSTLRKPWTSFASGYFSANIGAFIILPIDSNSLGSTSLAYKGLSRNVANERSYNFGTLPLSKIVSSRTSGPCMKRQCMPLLNWHVRYVKLVSVLYTLLGFPCRMESLSLITLSLFSPQSTCALPVTKSSQLAVFTCVSQIVWCLVGHLLGYQVEKSPLALRQLSMVVRPDYPAFIAHPVD